MCWDMREQNSWPKNVEVKVFCTYLKQLRLNFGFKPEICITFVCVKGQLKSLEKEI